MQRLELNGTVVELIEKDGMVSVAVQTNDAHVYLNDQLIYAKYEKPEYANVPAFMRAFIAEREDYLEEREDEIIADLYEKGLHVQASFYISKNTRNPLTIRMDYITSLDDLKTEFLENWATIDAETAKELYAKFSEMHESILKKAEKYGYKWKISHPVNEFIYAWWDLIVPFDRYDEEAILDMWRDINAFDRYLAKIVDQYS